MSELAPDTFDADDWKRLEHLRAGFLGSGDERRGPLRSRWSDARDLELYDATLARRIAWKLRAVLGELAARGWDPPAGDLLDWGCGSGVASRELVAAFGARRWERLRLFDRSPEALDFAARALREELGIEQIAMELDPPREAPALLVASHVLNELGPRQRDELVELARRSRAALFVEPGERGASRRLGELREELRSDMRVLAPCPHEATCGALASERDWCHFFARPPAEAHRERAWSEIARRLGIDLRSLPYSFLLLEAKSMGTRAEAPAGLARVIGRPRSSKADVRFDACDASGLRTMTLRRRDDPALHRALSDGLDAPALLSLESSEARVLAARLANLPLGATPD